MNTPVNNSNTSTDTARQVVADLLHVPLAKIKVEAVSGGYSRNLRALMGYDDEWVFVKEVDVDVLPDDGETELGWLAKDYGCTAALREIVPELVPEWSQLARQDHVLMMKSYRTNDGWLWSSPKDSDIQKEYIQAVIDATKKLETVQFDAEAVKRLSLQPYFRDKLAFDDGLTLLRDSRQLRGELIEKYSLLIHDQTLEHLHSSFRRMLDLLNDDVQLAVLCRHGDYLHHQPEMSFNHCDVRSDNIAYHADTQQVIFVDWNWASFAPARFGATEFLVDMVRRGADATPWVAELNADLLATMVGLYAKSCVKAPLAPGNTLRDMQIQTAAVALSLYDKVMSI